MIHGQRLKYRGYLQGQGLEIGALNLPFPVPPGTKVLYSDILTPEQVAARYPGSQLPDIHSDSESYPGIGDDAFDFIISNHVLEHVTDPIRALTEWHRLLRPGGILYLTVPDKRFTFDAPRERTTLAHLIEDHQSQEPPGIRNLCHLEDWATHVEGLAPGTPQRTAFLEHEKAKGYSVHNHVWVLEDILELLTYLNRQGVGFSLIDGTDTHPGDLEFILILRKEQAPRRGLGFRAWRISTLGQARQLAYSPVLFAKYWASRLIVGHVS